MAKNYGELLKDPRWQKKRLAILSRDNFMCKLCGSTHDTLNVHHLWYGKEPWDVPNNLLITLCESCHKKEENVSPNLVKAFNIFSEHGILKTDMMEVCLAAFEYSTDSPTGSVRDRILNVIEVLKRMRKGA